MNSVVVTKDRIPAMSDVAIDNVRKLEQLVMRSPQINIGTEHLLHAGMYARTVKVPAGAMITGALIKIATVLVVSGHCVIYLDGEAKEHIGYAVYPASAKRKQAFVAVDDTYLTMLFPSTAKTVQEAEEQFTDEFNLLVSRHDTNTNTIIVTGE